MIKLMSHANGKHGDGRHESDLEPLAVAVDDAVDASGTDAAVARLRARSPVLHLPSARLT